MPISKPSIESTFGLVALSVILLVTGTSASAQEEVLHSFTSNSSGKLGYDPYGGVVFDAAGNLYGTTQVGGTYDNGIVFELMPKAGGWTEKVLHNFGAGKDGYNPAVGLTFDASGNLYGSTLYGGAYSRGIVFELTPKVGGGWAEKVLHNFGQGTDGQQPFGNLTLDASRNLYGATLSGGAASAGTVFKLTHTPAGNWAETVLHSFSDNGTDGFGPFGGLIFDAVHNLYGTTASGGAYGRGTAFELTPATGGSWTEAVLYDFGNGTDGYDPNGGLIFDAAGNLYGTTAKGGPDSGGTVFELTPATGGNWAETLLEFFNNNPGTGGYDPTGGLIFDAAGNLYGTTIDGGLSGGGTLFELTPAAGGGWTALVLHSFGLGKDGSSPQTTLTFDDAGNLYGTTVIGGVSDDGTVFAITP
jgi:uncharacterized repeat protein (TIGR03803 family)